MSVDTSSKNRSGRDGSSLRSPLLGGAIGGVVHVIVVEIFWRFFVGYRYLPHTLSGDQLRLYMLSMDWFFLYELVGAFALGFIPVFLYVRWGSVSPGLLIGSLFCLSGYGSWTALEVGFAPDLPTAFDFYIFFWVGVAVLALGVGWVEMRFRS